MLITMHIKKYAVIATIAALFLLAMFFPHLKELVCQSARSDAKNCISTFFAEDDDGEDD